MWVFGRLWQEGGQHSRGPKSSLLNYDFFPVHLAHNTLQRSALTCNRILRFFSSFCAIQRSARSLRRFLIEFPKSGCGGGGLPSDKAPPIARCRPLARAGWRAACGACTGAGIGRLPASHAVGCQNPFSKFPHTKSGSCRPLGAPHPGAAGPEPKTTSRVYEKGRPKGSPGERLGASQ